MGKFAIKVSTFYEKVFGSIFPYDYTNSKYFNGFCKNQIDWGFYRISLFLITLVNFFLVQLYSLQNDFIYFTFWGLTLTLFTVTILTIQYLLYKLNVLKNNKFWKFIHFIFTINFLLQLFINGIFWFGMFPFAIHNFWGTMKAFDIFVPVMQHAVPLIILFIQLNLNTIIMWNYAYIPLIFICLLGYLGINIKYTLTVRPVYPMINYQNYLSFIFLGSAILAVLICGYLTRQYCKYFRENKIKQLLNLKQSQQLNGAVKNEIVLSTANLVQQV